MASATSNSDPPGPIGQLIQSPAVQDLAKSVEGGGVLSIGRVSESARPLVAAMLHRLFPGRLLLVVVDGLRTQEQFQQDLETWLNPAPETMEKRSGEEGRNINDATPIHFFPDWEILAHEDKLPHLDVINDRLKTLMALHSAKGLGPEGCVVVTNAVALMEKTFHPDSLSQRSRSLDKGDRIDPLDLIEWLEEQGYEPEVQVSHPGEVALRGGIVDLYPLASPWPVRCEFFGDELESIRYFDPVSQVSREEIDSVAITPAGELGLLKPGIGRGEGKGSSMPAVEPASLLDYLPDDSLILLSEPDRLSERAEQFAESMPEQHPLYSRWPELLQQMEARKFGVIRMIDEPEARPGMEGQLELPIQDLEAFRPVGERRPDPQVAEAQRLAFLEQMHRWLRQGYGVHVYCNNEGELQRFQEIWSELKPGSPSDESFPQPAFRIGSIHRGFLFEAMKLVVVTDAEIFGRYKVQRPRRLKASQAARSRSLLDIDFTELEEGDYVVHLQHGIGRYRGLQVMPVGRGVRGRGAEASDNGQECLVIEYAPRDLDQEPPKLHVPVTEAHLVSKYVGAGKARPPLNQLGGTRWTKTREQAQQAVQDLAGEMLRIQAVRDSQSGYSFGEDTPWQREFEASFLFEETPDQMRAITEAKRDLEGPKPMDRLVCGDVGYGKTEVAIRAAFKAVMEGRQVAILVPTTVLAQQHYNTFSERMSDYPIRVDLLSRFRTRRQQQKTIQDLASGAVDIVIGTHRLVQKDVSFKDLGLVVIDEEQRFGVKHKEQFKRLRSLVDVLTLSATPIPRTLYLALTGARDMSTIETPPQDRLPVETIVAQFDERLVRDAIRRELNRQGQVFFLHNRVTTIDAMGIRLKKLVPEARILIGHGQMKADELEEVMTRFVNGEADVLLCTTIIESGIDIPNANTIIIDRADRFGLAELYQLRGRVGRYKHQAHAYLLIPRHARLLTDARKRISAIRQYSSLGSGFKIAMRDLEIRGAGNLLGAQQSGHITAVGFDLYCQLLSQSIAKMKGEKPRQRIEVAVRLEFLSLDPAIQPAPATGNWKAGKETRQKKPAPEFQVPREVLTNIDSTSEEEDEQPELDYEVGRACIPLDYIPESRQRVEIYRRLASLMDASELDRLKGEIRDRFGPLPEAVGLLLSVAGLKLLAASKHISSIEVRDGKLMLTRNNDLVTVGGRFPRLTQKQPEARLREIRGMIQSM